MAEVECPHCGGMMEVEVGEGSSLEVQCPHCGELVGVQGMQDDELDGDRIQRISRARRSETRARAYGLIGGLAVMGGSADVIWMGIRDGRAVEWGAWAMGCVVAGVAGVVLGIRLVWKSR